MASPCTWDTQRSQPRADSASQRSKLTPWLPLKPEGQRGGNEDMCLGYFFGFFVIFRREDEHLQQRSLQWRSDRSTPRQLSAWWCCWEQIWPSPTSWSGRTDTTTTHTGNTPWSMSSLQRSFHNSLTKDVRRVFRISSQASSVYHGDRCIFKLWLDRIHSHGSVNSCNMQDRVTSRELTMCHLMMSSSGSTYTENNSGLRQLPCSGCHGPQTRDLPD